MTYRVYAGLKAIMKHRGVTALTISKELNYHPTHFSRKMSGINDWHTGDIRKISKLLDLTPDEINRAFELGGKALDK